MGTVEQPALYAPRVDIKIEAKPRNVLLVELVGIEYKLTPPKAALALKLATRSKQAQKAQDPTAMMETVDEWLDMAFGPEVAVLVRARIDDNADDLDIDHISELMKQVLETTSGTPTG